MTQLLEGLPVGTLAPSAILTLVALMYFTGKLVPERVVKQVTAEKDRLIESQDKRIIEQGETIQVLRMNNALLQGQGAVTTQVVAALPDVVSQGGS